MKTLFAIISCIAITYLLAQTSFAKNLASSIYNSFSTPSNPHNDDQASTASGLRQMISEYESTHGKNQEKISQLNAKVSELIHQVQTLHQQLDNIHANAKVVEVHNDINEDESKATNKLSVEVIENELSTQVNAVKSESIDDKFFTNEQQKRLRQQAVLRQIAEKMELSAIRNLGSGN